MTASRFKSWPAWLLHAALIPGAAHLSGRACRSHDAESSSAIFELARVPKGRKEETSGELGLQDHPFWREQGECPLSRPLVQSSRMHSSQKKDNRLGGSQRSDPMPISRAMLGKSLHVVSLGFSICEVGKVWDLIVRGLSKGMEVDCAGGSRDLAV